MHMTAKARAVLQLIADRQDKGYAVGARAIASVLWNDPRRAMRAGQYAGRLMNQRWLWRRMVWYRGRRGHEVYSHTEYFVTVEGRQELKRNVSRSQFDAQSNRTESNNVRKTNNNKQGAKPKNESRKNTRRTGEANQPRT